MKKLSKSQEVLQIIKEAETRYTVKCSNKDYESHVPTLQDAIPIVKALSDNDRVVILDKKRNDKKVVFGNKKTAMSVLVSLVNKYSYI